MFSSKVVLITGASSGIGAATAVRFAAEGAKLALTGRNVENLQATAQKCEEKNQLKPLIIKADLGLDDDVKNIINTVITIYEKLDVLINNAGVFFISNPEDVDMKEYDEIFSTNVRSIYYLTNLAIPHLIKSKGAIVNVSSLAAIRPFAACIPYCMSKAALDHFTRCLALQLAPKQVRVNNINPGVIPTDIHRRAGIPAEQIQLIYERCKDSHLLGRAGTVEEAAEVIVFLASEKSSFVTGETLLMDGGCHLSSATL
ncbi:hypothetical protein MML48_2g00017777 [Holotrichia oblita]|uniref:Uncharacterized protein n=2 Tax=Holotrichia oblita TaxID=644536 RepID=A0ACB9TNW7_HOLOL|nr:hypothetical protein MML48_2g00019373 [Holotrichia oblita]KAI4468519.1 hypothetical protein MML48_2g00017777 [Holotrichia oblita]